MRLILLELYLGVISMFAIIEIYGKEYDFLGENRVRRGEN